MVKKLFLSVMVLAIMVATPLAFASGSLPGTGWWTKEVIQNVSGNPASIAVTAYATGAGAATYTASSSNVLAGASVQFLPSNFSGMGPGFSGGGVVSSDQPVVAMGYLSNARSVDNMGVVGGKAADYYQGMSAPNTTLFFTNAKYQWCNTTILYYIQNTGSVSTTVQVQYSMGLAGTIYNYTTPYIQPNQMVVVSPADANVVLPTNKCDAAVQSNIGSAKLTAAQPIAAMYVEYRTNESTATTISALRAFTPDDYAQAAYAPAIKYNWGSRYSGIPLMNVDSVPITITVNYRGTAGACLNQDFQDVATNLAPGKSVRFVMVANMTSLPPTCVAAATIIGTGNFLAIVNESNSAGPAAGSVWYAFPGPSATLKIAAPQFKDNRSGITSGYQIQNTGATTATITATFNCIGRAGGTTDSAFTAVTKPIQIGSGSSFLFYRPSTTQQSIFTSGNPFTLYNSICGVNIDSDQPVVGLINEVSLTAGALDDARYNAFNLP